jgi:competence protein ComEA
MRNRKKWMIYVVCFALIFNLAGCASKADMILKGSNTASGAEDDVLQSEDDVLVSKEQETSKIYVYICGAVQNPGVYEMEADSRIYQVVEAAGGFLEEADAQSVNLAETVTDGQMVRIPSQSDGETSSSQVSIPGISADGKININTASVEQLMTLSGIGQTKAEQIVAYREKNGAFADTEAIMQVSGIAEGTYEKIKDDITVQ